MIEDPRFVRRAINHEVVASQSPGLLYSATLGMTAARSPTPTGLRPMFDLID